MPEHLGSRGDLVTFSLHAIFGRGREIDDGVDSIRRNTQFERQFDIPAAEGVNEGIDFSAGRGADSIFHTIAVGNRNYAVVAEPLVIRIAGQADDFGSSISGQLHGD